MVGNDIVDLRDPRTFRVHPRSDSRIFTRAEKQLIESRHIRWGLWACKEAAYKACKRLDPSAVFIPVLFEVQGWADKVAVHWKRQTVQVCVETNDDFAHAWTAGSITAIGKRDTEARLLASRMPGGQESFAYHGRFVAVAVLAECECVNTSSSTCI